MRVLRRDVLPGDETSTGACLKGFRALRRHGRNDVGGSHGSSTACGVFESTATVVVVRVD